MNTLVSDIASLSKSNINVCSALKLLSYLTRVTVDEQRDVVRLIAQLDNDSIMWRIIPSVSLFRKRSYDASRTMYDYVTLFRGFGFNGSKVSAFANRRIASKFSIGHEFLNRNDLRCSKMFASSLSNPLKIVQFRYSNNEAIRYIGALLRVEMFDSIASIRLLTRYENIISTIKNEISTLKASQTREIRASNSNGNDLKNTNDDELFLKRRFADQLSERLLHESDPAVREERLRDVLSDIESSYEEATRTEIEDF